MSLILVLGAGELGLPILHALSALASSFPPSSRPTIDVLLRPSTISSPSSSKSTPLSALHKLGIRFLGADIATSTAADLAALIQNKRYDTVISCTGFSSGPGTQLKIADAVLDAGTVHHYYPWQFGVDYDIIGPDAARGLFREQCEVRQRLRRQEKVKWTIVSTGMFTSFLFEPSFGAVEGLGGNREGGVMVRALGAWDNEVTVTTPRDIGTVVAKLVLEDRREGVVYTAGDTVSYEQLAGLVEEKVGRGKVRREVWGLDFLRSELEKEPDDAIRKYRVVFAEGRGVSWEKGSAVNVELGVETTDVKGFLDGKVRVDG